MEFKFEIQDYQEKAVQSVTDVFKGQVQVDEEYLYTRDLGKIKSNNEPMNMAEDEFGEIIDLTNDVGYRNDEINLSEDELLQNIHQIQDENNIIRSAKLVKDLGKCCLDIEMETGTGKTYTYINTIFELNKKYGFTKFIVVVPSVAIREGVKKTFDMTQSHFYELYKQKARYFIYDSGRLNDLDTFSSSAKINVMIINTQAFTKSLKEGSNTKDSRIIYSKRDEFASRRPIDVIKKNRPILILDEPQKMGGDATQKSLKNFSPLFSLSYSATHAKENNMIYVLDALEAYNQKLVKKIEVKGFEIKNLLGTNSYLYLEEIVITPKKPPRARINIEISYKNNIKRQTKLLEVDDNLFFISKEMQQYQGYTISNIDPLNGVVEFTNGAVLYKGEVSGDITETDMRRIQIRETILSHFEKEKFLFNHGIKTLSLFFIDEVSKFHSYNDDGEEVLGEYIKIFEEEYIDILNENSKPLENTEYQKYLQDCCSDVENVYNGYFSIDKVGKKINSKTIARSDISDDISAYDLILKNKERLLSLEEPTRFIFSHSALREGWDNPNIFQICTLKQSNSQTVKRQEVGRGLRICVDDKGIRQDLKKLESEFHEINKLTVIASESYQNFVSELQEDIKKTLYNRPTKATIDYFEGKNIKKDDENIIITPKQAKIIYNYLVKNDYIDDDDNITKSYRESVESENLEPFPDKENLIEITQEVHKLIQAIFDESVLAGMIYNPKLNTPVENKINEENFKKEEWKALWNKINHKYAYKVEFDGNELIEKSVNKINAELFVTKLKYTRTIASQKEKITSDEINSGNSFTNEKNKTKELNHSAKNTIQYDLVGNIASNSKITRKSVVKILQDLTPEKFAMYKVNPEEFISKVSNFIKGEKATMIVEHIGYNKIDGKYSSDIFTSKQKYDYTKSVEVTKHIQNYVITDGVAKESVEYKFAKALESAEEVCVYAKLPRAFKIPTPVGNYSPDWAIAFNEGTVKHIFFVAETKGTMDSLELRPIEKAKISCAKKLFNEISSENVRYHDVSTYEDLLNIINDI